ncbi:MAG: flagellar biosynthesis protein FliQ [Betaproteobacteria bacterium]|uniref:flagellar biosynthesis protein FliQ n=1 Tax=Thiomonas sp. FB-6 TaxID=1158291 RepID=UPI00035E8405|nr:flagellar biosynthesis protein FliQ [Thiomonas sp. FB-6]MBU6441697.1 flagellar biosynthesis protein FliQ [Betaproteobacteria bacterium]MBU6513924.1 flagellar biosynthesis protein FliQ [Betaproteobacteria bacterium]MDE1956753.1 flagellar biosynthesis protein FliQ [Betaproteobacteria bacterium]MDE2154065.1 flagellar biosynthesis protein FliQ [Betaproteobacteria bacterium]MDE2480056.1 flagellar biosynthesis protein FliQ [Betaproteobacteria bacterium]
MSPEAVVSLGQQALWVMFLVSLPLLGVALVVGLLVSLLQAATQLNEMTLSFVPKVLAIGLAAVLAGPWMLHVMMDFTTRLLLSIPQMLGS